METEIIPFFGFDNIKFGISRNKIIEILGDPSNIVKEKYADESIDLFLEYQHLGFDLILSSDDNYRLGSINFYSTDFTFKGLTLIDLSEEDLKNKTADLIPDLNLEDNFVDLDSKDYYSELNGMSLWINGNIVDSITIYPQFGGDDDTIIWPD